MQMCAVFASRALVLLGQNPELLFSMPRFREMNCKLAETQFVQYACRGEEFRGEAAEGQGELSCTF
jgi:hypothetical protein